MKCSILLALGALASPLHAQVIPDSVKLRNDCRLANEVISTGSAALQRQWALGIMWRCAHAGSTIGAALVAAKTSSDTAYLNALTAPAIELRDRDLFAAALAVAADKAASVPARIFAVRVLINAVHPGWYSGYAELSGEGNRSCYSTGSPHALVRVGRPLPGDFVAQVARLASGIYRDTAQPVRVRHAARCAMFATGRY